MKTERIRITMTPGQIAFEAWMRQHHTWHRCKMDGWQEISEDDRADWEAAAQAVLTSKGA